MKLTLFCVLVLTTGMMSHTELIIIQIMSKFTSVSPAMHLQSYLY